MGPINGLDAQSGPYERLGCTWWDQSAVLMNRVGPVNGLDGQDGPYKWFGCAGRAL